MSDRTSWLKMLAAVLADVTVLLRWMPNWQQLRADLLAPQHWVHTAGTDSAAITLVSAAIWLVAVWLGVGLLVAAAAALPGRFGQVAAVVSGRMLPAFLQRLVLGAAGASILLSPAPALAATPAMATQHAAVATHVMLHTTLAIGPGRGQPAQPVPPAIRWPSDGGTNPSTHPPGSTPTPPAPSNPAPANPAPGSRAPSKPAPSLPISAPAMPTPPPKPPAATSPPVRPPTSGPPEPTRPTTPTTPAPPVSAPAAPPAPGRRVTVKAGDSLWVIAAHRLGSHPTDAQIAQEWPRWYQANRQAIGADPNLLSPGTRLVAPTQEG